MTAPDTIARLTSAALLSGFVDAIAGGGGLIGWLRWYLPETIPPRPSPRTRCKAVLALASAALSRGRAGLVSLRVQRPISAATGVQLKRDSAHCAPDESIEFGQACRDGQRIDIAEPKHERSACAGSLVGHHEAL